MTGAPRWVFTADCAHVLNDNSNDDTAGGVLPNPAPRVPADAPDDRPVPPRPLPTRKKPQMLSGVLTFCTASGVALVLGLHNQVDWGQARIDELYPGMVKMGKHDDDKDRSRQNSDPSKWQKIRDDTGGRHNRDNPPKDNPPKDEPKK